MTQNEKEIEDLRIQFLKKLEGLDSDVFHPADISRVKSDDAYLKRFLLHHDWNVDNAFSMLWETCEWRKKFGANDITDRNVNRDLLELGSVFPYGKDKDGKTLLVFKSKKHYKGVYDFEDQKRCLVYWMERLERQENGDMISLFFDMEGAVISNMDMEYTKYIIDLFKNYYPYFLNYIIVFEMAWILNAVFKVIKNLLPPKALEKMKIVNKSSVKDYIDLEHAMNSWGGRHFYVYQFEPEELPATLLANNGEDNRKKVHFADLKQEPFSENSFDELSMPTSSSFNSSGVSLTAADVMVFNNEGSEVVSSISLKNEESQYISYKIKTTSPEKFRVRPSTGILAPGAGSIVSVVLLPGYQMQSLQRDKFLIMSIPVENAEMSQQEINELWKQVGDKGIHQHKLRCIIPQATSNDVSVKNGSIIRSQGLDEQKAVSKLSADIIKLNTYMSSLKEELGVIKKQQWIILFTLSLLICSISYAMFSEHFNFSSQKQNCWSQSRHDDL